MNKKFILIIIYFLCFSRYAWASPNTFDLDVTYYKFLSGDKARPEDQQKNAPKMEEIIRYWADALYESTNGQGMLGKIKLGSS